MARALANRRKPAKAAAPSREHAPAHALHLPELDRLIHERIRLGMKYIRNYTIWSDIHILFQTIGVVWRGKGAV